MSRYDQFLKKDNYQSTRQLREKEKSKEEAEKAEVVKYKSIKINETTYQKLELLKLATSESYISHLDQAVANYFDDLKRTNDRLRALDELV